MENKETIYLIPRSLNREFTLVGAYTIGDIVALILMIAAAVAVMYVSKSSIGFLPVVLTAVFKFKYDERTVYFWMSAALRFLYRRATGQGTYILFEKEEKAVGTLRS